MLSKKFPGMVACVWALLIPMAEMQAQNLGLGTNAPGFILDINGRARLRHANNVSSGVWFDGAGTTLQGFMGLQTNDVMGWYGHVSGWQLGINVNTGQVGVGTMAPTAALDINGGFRWRGATPQTHAVLMSKDNDGNATWQRPIAFGVSGSIDLTDQTFSSTDTWTRLEFSTSTDYNQGLAWLPVQSLFEAPVKGVYRFNLHLHHANEPCGAKIRFIRRRAGINYLVAEQETIAFNNGYRVVNSTPLDMHQDLLMEAQDQLWVEINPGFVFPAKILGAKRLFAFSGRLLFLQ